MRRVNFRELGYHLWEKRIPILVTVFLFFLLSVAYTLNFTTPIYQASTTLEIAKENSKLEEKRTNTYIDIIQSQTMLEQVIQKLELRISAEELQKNLVVKQLPDTVFLQLVVKQENPQDAIRIADKLAENFVEKAKVDYHIGEMEVTEKAILSSQAYYMLSLPKIVLFCLAGFVLAIGCISISYILEEQKRYRQTEKQKQEKEKKEKTNQEKGEKNETNPKHTSKKNS